MVWNDGEHMLGCEAHMIIHGLTGGEQLYWMKVEQDSAGRGIFKRVLTEEIPKYGYAQSLFGYLDPKEKAWIVENASTDAGHTNHRLQNGKSYMISVIVYHQPSETDSWNFTLAISDDGLASMSEPKKGLAKET